MILSVKTSGNKREQKQDRVALAGRIFQLMDCLKEGLSYNQIYSFPDRPFHSI